MKNITVNFSEKALRKLVNLHTLKSLTGDFTISDSVVFKILAALESGKESVDIKTKGEIDHGN